MAVRRMGVDSRAKGYECKEHLITVEATRPDAESRWTIEVFVRAPDGRQLTRKDDDNTFVALEDAFAAGFVLGHSVVVNPASNDAQPCGAGEAAR